MRLRNAVLTGTILAIAATASLSVSASVPDSASDSVSASVPVSASVSASVSDSGSASTACPPAGHTRTTLLALRSQGFVVSDDHARQRLAIDLLDCLAAPDPELRDGVAFEALAAWLRDTRLTADTRAELLTRLLALLTAPDPAGFSQPFAALVLSEVVRTDRIEPWLTAAMRETVLTAATHYLSTITDYRGFDDTEGWRHGIAHGADLLLQLALNPALDSDQIERLLAAVASQIAPANGHAYIYGESERLARPVLYAALRETRSDEHWHTWFTTLASPGPSGDWAEAMKQQAGLARRHNLRAFLAIIYSAARDSSETRIAALAPHALAALRTIP